MKLNVATICVLGLLLALMVIFIVTPLGYIPIGAASITLMCIPVIIGTLSLGLVPGLILGFLFGCTSFYMAVARPEPLFAYLIGQVGLLPFLPVIFLPRLLIPLFTHLTSRGLKRAPKAVHYGFAAVVGSLTNTVFFLGMLYVFFSGLLPQAMGTDASGVLPVLLGIVFSNGLLEAAAAVLLCTPIILALERANLRVLSPRARAQ